MDPVEAGRLPKAESEPKQSWATTIVVPFSCERFGIWARFLLMRSPGIMQGMQIGMAMQRQEIPHPSNDALDRHTAFRQYSVGRPTVRIGRAVCHRFS
jgi:hypothetical protein